jgi:adenylate cyclase
VDRKSNELLGMVGEFADASGWIQPYETGLVSYRKRDFNAAIGAFERTLDLRTDDQASSLRIERCKQQLENPAGDDG